MAVITQKPDALTFSGNLKKFILSSGSVISFVLKDGGTTLLDASYEPGADGKVTIDVRDIIEARLGYLVKADNFYQQTALVKTFTAVIDGTETTFRAIRAGVANLSDTPANWLAGNFLTWQPVNKQVTYYSPEWITYYATVASTLKLKAYFDDAPEQIITLGTMVATRAYTANLQYATIAGLLGNKYPKYFEVYVENSSNARLTYLQRYLYSNPKSEQEQWFLFENSLGGLDTLRAGGDTDFEGAHEHKISHQGDLASEYDIDTNRSYDKNTGYLTDYERRWLLDFFPARAKYIYASGALRSVVITESDARYTASNLPSSFNFTYQFSEKTTLLNLIRNTESIPQSITIPDIDSPDFSLPPRLSEYPRVPLHEGVILPAFDPHYSDPTVTTVGAILAAAVAKAIESIEAGEGGGELVDMLRVNSPAAPSDFNVFSAARTLLEINKAYNILSDDVKEKLENLTDKIGRVKTGSVNLLRNTGFLGDFKSLDIDALTAVLENIDVGTNSMVHWVHNNTEVIDAPSRSGKGVKIGSIQQTVNLRAGESYVISFRAKGNSLTVNLVESEEISLTGKYEKHTLIVVANRTGPHTFGMLDSSNTAEVYEIMLSEGNTDGGYSYAPEDDLKAISQLQAINTITSALKDFDTDILGGLILTSMIQFGKYKDGVMEKVNAGINGIYNHDDDPAFWAGGSFEEAIRTVQRMKSNPYSISEEDWEDLANIVLTHGGDGIFRGIIYALGGIFRGRIESNADGNRIIIDPSTRSLKAIDDNDRVRFEISFNSEEPSVTTELTLNTYTEEGDLAMKTTLRALGLKIQTYVGTPLYGAEFNADGLSFRIYNGDPSDPDDVLMNFSLSRNSIGGFTQLVVTGLPSDPDVLPKGGAYVDYNGNVKIKK